MKYLFYITFGILCVYIYNLILQLEKQKDCPCDGWKKENIKMVSFLGIILCFVNLIIPLNKTLYRIPILSNIFSIGLLIIIISFIFVLGQFFRYLKENEKCITSCHFNAEDNVFISFVLQLNTFTTVIVGILITIGFLYV